MLSQDTCRDKLLHCRRGFLACSARALPTLLPADLRMRQGRLLVTVHDPVLADQLVGQVVAVGLGRRPLLFLPGWRVVARGKLGPPDGDDNLALPLEPYQLEGATYGRAPTCEIDHLELRP